MNPAAALFAAGIAAFAISSRKTKEAMALPLIAATVYAWRKS